MNSLRVDRPSDTSDLETANAADSVLLPSQGGHPDLMTWLYEKDVNLLWITGKAGCGKTTFMKQLIRDCKRRDEPLGSKSVTAFCIFSAAKGHTGPTYMLRVLLTQIFDQSPTLARAVAGRDFKPGWSLITVGQNWQMMLEIFRHIIESSNDTAFHLFIDALDEWRSDTGITNELPQMFSLIDSILSYRNVKVCFSGRPVPAVEHMCRSRMAQTFRLDTHNLDDISRYVDRRVQSLEREGLSSGYLDNVRQELLQKSEGMFLWTALATSQMIDSIVHGATLNELREVLRAMPPGLDQTYQRMIDTIPKPYAQEAWQTLTILALATSPVDFAILSWATDGCNRGKGEERPRILSSDLAAVNDKELDSIKSLTQANQDAQRRIISRTGGLIVCRDNQAMFMHQTARDFIGGHTSEAGAAVDPVLYLGLLGACVLWLKLVNKTEDLKNLKEESNRCINSGIYYARMADALLLEKTYRPASLGMSYELPPTVMAYARLFQEFCGVVLKTQTSQMQPSSASTNDAPALQEDLDAKHEFLARTPLEGASILAARYGLMTYFKAVDPSRDMNRSKMSPLLNSLLPESPAVPWDNTFGYWDLPEPDLVKLLFERGADPDGLWQSTSLWHIVLEYGYHCFSSIFIPRRPGPTPSRENRKRWVGIVELFLAWNADVVSEHPMAIRSREDIAGADSGLPTSPGEDESITVRQVTVESALVGNLSGDAEFTSDLRRLLDMVRRRKESQRPISLNNLIRASSNAIGTSLAFLGLSRS